MSSYSELYAQFQMDGYDPSEPQNCGACGSTDIRWDPADGWCCGGCGRCDSDE